MSLRFQTLEQIVFYIVLVLIFYMLLVVHNFI